MTTILFAGALEGWTFLLIILATIIACGYINKNNGSGDFYKSNGKTKLGPGMPRRFRRAAKNFWR